MNRTFGIISLLFVSAVNVVVVGMLFLMVMLSVDRIEWMREHGMNNHEVVYVISCVLMLILGGFALWEGWRMTKLAYAMIRYDEEPTR